MGVAFEFRIEKDRRLGNLRHMGGKRIECVFVCSCVFCRGLSMFLMCVSAVFCPQMTQMGAEGMTNFEFRISSFEFRIPSFEIWNWKNSYCFADEKLFHFGFDSKAGGRESVVASPSQSQ